MTVRTELVIDVTENQNPNTNGVKTLHFHNDGPSLAYVAVGPQGTIAKFAMPPSPTVGVGATLDVVPGPQDTHHSVVCAPGQTSTVRLTATVAWP